jgi:hypothetical protein
MKWWNRVPTDRELNIISGVLFVISIVEAVYIGWNWQ